ncbi:MAG: PD40 domain-containing protein, partial [Acidobacteria bacterium]|nr:PD40 domain-containing protein [Acidobacteriota bacterium]
GGNTDGNVEVFVYEVGSGQIIQATDTVGGGGYGPAVISDDGARIAAVYFSTTWEIQLIDYPSLAVTPLYNSPLRQLTIDLTASGDQVVSSSGDDLVPGRNADGNGEVFLVDPAGNFEQVTDTMTGGSGQASISADGRYIAFTSTSELSVPAGGNGQIILADRALGTFTSILPGVQGSSQPSISADGQRIAFTSREDPVGDNPPHDEELLLAECTLLGEPAVAIPAHSTFGLLLLAGLLLAVAVWRLRRSVVPSPPMA